jgi:hypothetical protein
MSLGEGTSLAVHDFADHTSSKSAGRTSQGIHTLFYKTTNDETKNETRKEQKTQHYGKTRVRQNQ